MARRASNTNTARVPLIEARRLVTSAYGATQLAEKLLVRWLGEGRVRWSCRLFEPARVSDLAVGRGLFVAKAAYSEGDPAFWRTSLEINWEESWAREKYVVGGTRAYQITVVREDVLALLPGERGEHESASKVWLTAEARRMKAAGQILPSMEISEFARELARRMDMAADADRSIRPLKWQSIRNRLREWGLWPVASIR